MLQAKCQTTTRRAVLLSTAAAGTAVVALNSALPAALAAADSQKDTALLALFAEFWARVHELEASWPRFNRAEEQYLALRAAAKAAGKPRSEARLRMESDLATAEAIRDEASDRVDEIGTKIMHARAESPTGLSAKLTLLNWYLGEVDLSQEIHVRDYETMSDVGLLASIGRDAQRLLCQTTSS